MLTFQRLQDLGLIDALAMAFDDEQEAKGLLLEVGFPEDRHPRFQTPRTFWISVCREMHKGIVRAGLEALLELAAQRYPGNPHLAAWGVPTPDDVREGTRRSALRRGHVVGRRAHLLSFLLDWHGLRGRREFFSTGRPVPELEAALERVLRDGAGGLASASDIEQSQPEDEPTREFELAETVESVLIQWAACGATRTEGLWAILQMSPGDGWQAQLKTIRLSARHLAYSSDNKEGTFVPVLGPVLLHKQPVALPAGSARACVRDFSSRPRASACARRSSSAPGASAWTWGS